jgi:hypothetical protein
MRTWPRTPSRHPPFQGFTDHSEDDNLTRAGAARLATKIEDAWAKVGVYVETQIIHVPHGRPHHAVRLLNFVNGLPQRQPEAAA